ncbi:hypothetical protein ACHAQA_008882 [Verticillium albo-atrum]
MVQNLPLGHLSIIIIGAGFGGLAAAIELASRGAKVQVFESYPDMKKQAASEKDLIKVWIAEDTHSILTTNRAANAATCFVTHKDQSDISEDWHVRGDVADMLACVDGWDPQLRKIIEKISQDSLIDHKLLWRNPVQKWVSTVGRVCLLGDSAHPHLATSGTGAAQAIEDAATIAVTLEGTSPGTDVPLALRIFEKLRYVSRARSGSLQN